MFYETLILLFVNFILYFQWKVIAIIERNKRFKSKKIPFYFSGDLGDIIGLSIVVYGFILAGVSLSIMNLYLAFFLSFFTTAYLNHYWKNKYKGKEVSLYKKNGDLTLAGILHLPYIFFISFLTFLFLLNINLINLVSIFYFVFGYTFYFICVVIDIKRGVL